MTRRLILGICLLGTIGGAAGTAFADTRVNSKPHQVCVVIYEDSGPNKDFCVDYGVAQQ